MNFPGTEHGNWCVALRSRRADSRETRPGFATSPSATVA